jgi:hypothetical protein
MATLRSTLRRSHVATLRTDEMGVQSLRFFCSQQGDSGSTHPQGKANHASSLEEEYGGDDGSGPSHMPVRADYYICMSYGLAALNAMRKALSIGGTNSFARSIPAQMDRTMILTNRTNWASWPCARFTKDDIDYFRTKVDETWEKWLVLGVLPLRKLWNLCGVGCRQRGNQRSTKTLKSDGHPRRCIYG